MKNPTFEAQWAYKEGEGINDNPYPKNSPEWLEWSLAMSECQSQELKIIRGELSWT